MQLLIHLYIFQWLLESPPKNTMEANLRVFLVGVLLLAGINARSVPENMEGKSKGNTQGKK